MVNHFWQSVDAILEDVYVTETIVWCETINLKTIIFQWSKNYRSPTRVTRLKVAPNTADTISLNEKKRSLTQLFLFFFEKNIISILKQFVLKKSWKFQ